MTSPLLYKDDNMTEEELLRKIGQRIKEIRNEKGMPQTELVGKLNSEKSNVSRLESGRINPRIYTLYRVAQALGISLDELVRIDVPSK